jgi:flagellar biosynthesis protein FlhG
MMNDAILNATTPSAGLPYLGLDDSPLMAKRRRGWELGLPAYVTATGKKFPIIIAIGGGKGGVGKSFLSANLSMRLAGSGYKVAAVDLDIGGSNLHTYFGVGHPKYSLADAIIYKNKSFGEILIPTGVQGVRLAAGGREEVWGGAQALDDKVMASIFDMILGAKEAGEADFVILDLGAGTSRHTLDFFSAANLALLTVLPEPTSIENAYLFLKIGLFRLIENLGCRLGAVDTAEDVKAALLAADTSDARGTRTSGYAEKLRQIGATYPTFISQLALALSGRMIGITVNQVRGQKDIDVGKSMELIGQRYFGFQTRDCGYLNYDEAAWKSLRNRRLMMIDFPHSILARRMNDVAKSVLKNLGF